MARRRERKTRGSYVPIDPVTFYVAYEGAVDEASYFNALASVFLGEFNVVPKRYSNNFKFVSVDKKSTAGANVKVFEDLDEKLKENGINKVDNRKDVAFIVIDKDGYFEGTHLKGSTDTLQKCRQKNIKVICSVPSFETWIILHKLDLTTKDDTYLIELEENKKTGGKNFAKRESSKLINGEGIISIFPLTDVAIENEDKLKEKLKCDQTPPTVVQSNVGIIFKEIEKRGYPIIKYLKEIDA